jgi:hypothetical protein
MEDVCDAIGKIVSKDPLLKTLHSMCYGRLCTHTQVKSNLRAFSGLVYEGEGGREKVEDKARKLSVADLKKVSRQTNTHIIFCVCVCVCVCIKGKGGGRRWSTRPGSLAWRI